VRIFIHENTIAYMQFLLLYSGWWLYYLWKDIRRSRQRKTAEKR